MTEEKLFNIERDGKIPLSFYLFSVQRGPLYIDFSHDVKAILAYSEEDALNKVKAEYPS